MTISAGPVKVFWVSLCGFGSIAIAATSEVDRIVPSNEHPYVSPNDKEKQQALANAIQEYMTLPPAQVHAHPAAADFPGIGFAKANHVKRVRTFTAPFKDWLGTGLYARPGETVTVTPRATWPEGVKVSVRIGCHTDNPFYEKQWSRFPLLVRSFKIGPEATPVANAFGGPIFVEIETGKKVSVGDLKLEIEFAGAVDAPHFVLGQTTPEDWKRLRQAPAPWSELAGHNLVLHVPSKLVRKMEDPAPLIEWWDKVVAAEDKLTDTKRERPERVVFERQMGDGVWGHDGYPVMVMADSAAEIVDLEKLRRDGNWGLFHELGHNHQSDMWTPPGYDEVTVNFFSIYCMEKIVGKKPAQVPEQHVGLALLTAVEHCEGHAANDKDDPFDRLAPFVVLLRKFGWEPMRKTLVSYKSNPLPDGFNQQDAQIEFIRRYSRNAKSNLSGFFKRIGYPCPKTLVDELKDLPAFDYPAWRKEYAAKHTKK